MDATISVNTALGKYCPDHLCLSPDGIDSAMSEEKKAEDNDNQHRDEEEAHLHQAAAFVSVLFPIHAGSASLLGMVLEANAFFKGLEQWILKAIHPDSPLADCSWVSPGDALVSLNGSTKMDRQLQQLADWSSAHAVSKDEDEEMETENAIQIVQMIFYKRSEASTTPETKEQTLVQWWIHPDVVATLQSQQLNAFHSQEQYHDEYNHQDAEDHDHGSADQAFGLYAYSNAHGYLTLHKTTGFWKDKSLIYTGDTLCRWQHRSTQHIYMSTVAQWARQCEPNEALSFKTLVASDTGRAFVQGVRENQMYLQEARRQARKVRPAIRKEGDETHQEQ